MPILCPSLVSVPRGEGLQGRAVRGTEKVPHKGVQGSGPGLGRPFASSACIQLSRVLDEAV